jgi:hypothetical protein
MCHHTTRHGCAHDAHWSLCRCIATGPDGGDCLTFAEAVVAYMSPASRCKAGDAAGGTDAAPIQGNPAPGSLQAMAAGQHPQTMQRYLPDEPLLRATPAAAAAAAAAATAAASRAAGIAGWLPEVSGMLARAKEVVQVGPHERLIRHLRVDMLGG